MGRLREQTARGLSLIATLYLRERHRWADFLAERGVVVPRYGPRPSSQFHAVCRHFLRVGAGGDRTGYAGKLAAVLDEWHRATETISPEQLPAWVEACGGIEHLYRASQFGATATSPSGARRAPAAADVFEDDASHQNQGLWNGGPAHYCHQHSSTSNSSPNHDITPLMKTKPLRTSIHRRIFLMRWNVSSTSIPPAQADQSCPGYRPANIIHLAAWSARGMASYGSIRHTGVTSLCSGSKSLSNTAMG